MTKKEKEDHDWLETLAGRVVENADPIIVKEARLVRKVIRERRNKHFIKQYIGDTDGNFGDC
tara:strand:+ start:1375 stop:1560 length:186 start_codon:yes stop_codon:yes gene_type:complete